MNYDKTEMERKNRDSRPSQDKMDSLAFIRHSYEMDFIPETKINRVIASKLHFKQPSVETCPVNDTNYRHKSQLGKVKIGDYSS